MIHRSTDVAMKTSMRGFVVLASALGAALLAGCGVGEAGVTAEAEPVTGMPVVTGQPVLDTAYAYHAGTVNLETDSEAAVVAKVDGEIVEILAEEGQAVKAGEIVARLDASRLRLVAEQARAELNRLKQEYRRNVQLHERGLVSEGAFENLRFDLESLDAAYKLAALDLDYANIRAPIDGIVSEKIGRVGNTVSAGSTILRISDSGNLLAYLHVPQRDMLRFDVGQSAELSLDALPGTTRDARILRISPRIDSGTGTVKVTLGVDNGDGLLRPGMFARAKIVYEVRENALMVPADAVVTDDAQPAVFVFEDGVARRRDITTGLANGDRIEVVSGLGRSDRIIVVGQSALRDGTPVTDHSDEHQI